MNVGFGSFSSDIDIAGLTDHHHQEKKFPSRHFLNDHKHSPSPLTVSPLVHDQDKTSISDASIPSSTAKGNLTNFQQVLLTIALYICFIGTGLNSGIIGPTLVHLEYLFDTDTSGISKSLAGMNLGYLIGTFLCALVFDRFNQEIQFSFWGTVLGMSCILVPWVPGIYYYYAITALLYVAQGFVYSGGQSYVIRLWKDHGKKEPALLGMYMCWSFGALVAPFLCMPFLDELHELDAYKNKTQAYLSLSHNKTISGGTKLLTGVHKVKYIYFMVGLFDILGSILFFFGFLLKGPRCRSDVVKQKESKYSDESRSDVIGSNQENLLRVKLCRGAIVFLVWFFAVLYFMHEYSIGCYISAFCLKGLNWPVEQSALVTSIFFGCLGLGRVIGIGITKFLSPTKMLTINICLTTTGLTLLLFSHLSSVVVWIAVALAGYGMSTTSPSYVLWTSNYITISGAMGAMFLAGSATGSMTVGWLVGYLFQHFTHMWVVYVSLGSSVFNIGVFVALLCIGKYFKNLKKQLLEDEKQPNFDKNDALLENNCKM